MSTPPPLPPPGAPPVLPDAATLQWIQDNEHLRLLSIFHYVLGGLAFILSSLFIIHVVFGVMMLHGGGPFGKQMFPPFVSDPAPTAAPGGTPAAPAPTPLPAHRETGQGIEPPAIFGYLMIGAGCFAVFCGWTMGALLIYSGRCLARRTRRTFSMVVAGLACLQVPLGTILGVFTLVTLQRPTVRSLYA